MSAVSQPDQVTTREAATIIGVSPATVKRAALSGDLPYASKYPTGTGGYLFTRSVVEMYARNRTRGAA